MKKHKRVIGLIYLIFLLLLINYVGEADALFIDQENLPNTVGTAYVDITATPTLGGTDLFNISDMLPGDTYTRNVEIDNAGNTDLEFAITVTNMASPLFNSPDGLHLIIKDESTTVVYNGLLNNASTILRSFLSTDSPKVYTFILSLPLTADNTLSNQNSIFTFHFNAEQLIKGRSL
ncbi:CalY family protein [Bacillus sp. EAC]|uniref:CalY family protein n=1 Tax=Bacillus sp. EAC TaxID=1978338 RepID=UPI00211AD62E|nr:CalY family protein [Bacillus sp. EAC]